jgi:nicastrin
MSLLPLLSVLCHSLQIPADFNFRIIHSTGWFGPKTKFDGYSGFMVRIGQSTDLDPFLAKKRPHPEVLVLPLNLVTAETIGKIEKLYHPHPFLQGIIALPADNSTHPYDVPFPNADQSCYDPAGYQWNLRGDSLAQAVTAVPIVYPPGAVAAQVKEHIARQGSRAGAYMRIFNTARGTDADCVASDQCQPIGGLSMFGSFDEKYGGPAVWAISSFDTTGLFPYGSTGADASVSGFVAQLAALQSLKGVDWKSARLPLRFAFFDGEAHGYVGSQGFLADIEQFDCSIWSGDHSACIKPYRLQLQFRNISIADFHTVVEMKSVANVTRLFAHGNIADEVTPLKTNLSISRANASNPGIPPSSAHSFVRVNSSIRHLVLAGFDSHYPDDNRYGSPSDVRYDAESVTKAAETLVQVWQSISGFELPATWSGVNETIVDDLMQGFVGIPRDSAYMKSLFPSVDSLPGDHVSLYSGICSFYTAQLKQRVVHAALKDVVAYNTSDLNCSQDDTCRGLGGDWVCSWAGKCERINIHHHPAYSRRYEWDDDKQIWGIQNTDSKLPSAAETVWLAPDIQLVTLPAYWTGRIAVGVGVFLWAASAVALGWFWSGNLAHLKTN